MMLRFFAVLTAAPVAAAAATMQTLVSAGDLAAAQTSTTKRADPFSITATVLHASAVYTNVLSVADSSGAAILVGDGFAGVSAGDLIAAEGRVQNTLAPGHVALCRRVKVLGHGAAPEIPLVSGRDFTSGRFDNRVVQLEGTVRDAFLDEVDSSYICLSVNSGGSFVPTFVANNGGEDNRKSRSFIGRDIRLTGLCMSCSHGVRFHIGRILQAEHYSFPQHEGTNSTIPELDVSPALGAEDIARLGLRKASGAVLAVWETTRILIRTARGEMISSDIVDKKLPAVGDFVEIIGFPVSNLFAINLTRAHWHASARQAMAAQTPERLSIEQTFVDHRGRDGIHPRLHGKLVTVSGRITHLPSEASDKGVLFLESGSRLLPVDTSACPGILNGLEANFLIELTGVMILNADEWSLGQVLPQAKGYTLVPRFATDVRILSRPSWWTSRRLSFLAKALLVALLIILVWNFLLHRISDRKGEALSKARLANSESQLKVQERTRLATELHDTIVQNLTGAAMELRTANRIYESDSESARQQLALAIKTLDSCRNEIRNCIWDLRSRALDESTMDAAIRRTLAPFADNIRLTIRFAVPRERLTDNTAHALICIVRELVSNAIRHGRATSVRIAGCIESGMLLFSVQDDGVGFDAENTPGPEYGHFGLQGVRERIEGLHGSMSISSSPGKGSRVSFEIALASEGKN